MVKKYFSAALFLLCLFNSKAQVPGEWVWISGTNTANSFGFYGLAGELDSNFYPPAVFEGAEWTDNNYNFWIFGGVTPGGLSNALFLYDRANNKWGLMSGTASVAQSGNYGTMGIPSVTNTPGARSHGAMTWTDSTGNLWLFGGLGKDKNGTTGELADLWKYSVVTNEWTWMAGPDTINSVGSYGTKGVASAANFPAGRHNNAATWVDSLNNLWLFGGLIGNSDYKNDLWKYDTGLNQWIWVSGSPNNNVSANYGVKGVEDSLNEPGGRYTFTRYKDGQDNLYLYGTSVTNPNPTLTTDVWKYNMSTGFWTWLAGTPTPAQFGNYVALCDTSSNMPLARAGNRASWGDSCGCFFMGGLVTSGISFFYNDLWYVNSEQDDFTWLSGSMNANSPCSYGVKGVSSPSNLPCPRSGALPFRDSTGNLWLFGGIDENGDYFNDLWMYTVDTSCVRLCRYNTPVSIKEVAQQDPKIYLYPNPVANVLRIAGTEKISDIRIFDLSGRAVNNFIIMKDNSVDVSGLGDGMYILQFANKDMRFSRRFIVRNPD